MLLHGLVRTDYKGVFRIVKSQKFVLFAAVLNWELISILYGFDSKGFFFKEAASLFFWFLISAKPNNFLSKILDSLL